MPQIKIAISEVIEVPEGAEIVLAPTGVVSGIRLPTGAFIKPWISFEHFVGSDDSDDPEGDLSTDELNMLGVIEDLDFDREMEVIEGEVSTDDSRVSAG